MIIPSGDAGNSTATHRNHFLGVVRHMLLAWAAYAWRQESKNVTEATRVPITSREWSHTYIVERNDSHLSPNIPAATELGALEDRTDLRPFRPLVIPFLRSKKVPPEGSFIDLSMPDLARPRMLDSFFFNVPLCVIARPELDFTVFQRVEGSLNLSLSTARSSLVPKTAMSLALASSE